MLVRNQTSKTITVCGWISDSGHGDDVMIDAGNEKNVWGPKIDQRGPISISGVATIIEGRPAKSFMYQLVPEQVLPIPSDENPGIGISVWYYSEDE